MSKEIKVIDLFAGVGGLSSAFYADPAFRLLAANELLEAPAKAYELNHPGVAVFQKDIRLFGASDLAARFGSENVKADLVIGGPPCQAYSTAGKRLMEDPRASLFQEYCRILEEVEPRMFLFENVVGLLSMQGRTLIEKIRESFESIGYRTRVQVLNAADYGAPQVRERVVLVGTSLKKEFSYPLPTHGAGLQPHLTLGEAIGDLPPIEPGGAAMKYARPPQNEFQKEMRVRVGRELTEHNSPNHSENLLAIMRALPEGGSPRDLPEKIRPKSGFGNSYARLWWDRPSTTITRNLGTPSSARCVHPKQARALTTREGARLQTFPDDFQFVGTRSQKNLQIGEAVPPVLSQALVAVVKEHLQPKANHSEHAAERPILASQAK